MLMDDTGENIRAGLPVYLVNSWLTGKRLVSIPFATLCDPLITSNEDMKLFFDAVLKLSEEQKASYIEIKSLKSNQIIQDERLGYSDFFKHHYLLLEKDPEMLRKNFHRTCVRQRISRAEKSGLDLRIAEDTPDLRSFYRLYLMTRKRLGLPTQPYRFIESLWYAYKGSNLIQILLALKNGQAIAGLVLFKYKDRVSAEFAASDDRFFNLSPNHYLFWQAIRSAYLEGYKIFDFGRTSPNNKTLMDFKDHWGTNIISLRQFYYPKDKTNTMAGIEDSWKYRMGSYACKKSPDAIQGLIGNICYRHLG